MSETLVSQVLGNNAFYTESYIEESISFVKSLLFKNDQEARLYNAALHLNHPQFSISQDRRTWRYYLHLQGLVHSVDAPVTLVSVDNGMTVSLSRATLAMHKKTRLELLKFGQYYDDLVKLYPEQHLFIKAVMTKALHSGIEELLACEDFTLVACNPDYIEENEHDLVPLLQDRITNYKSVWLISYYQMVDNLFLATQYQAFYQFLFTSLLAVRLANAKTMQAHSFHIRLYLASHYRLDQQMIFLSRRQQLYLYRNLLYLRNHSGKNHVFRTLINELFNEHNVSVVNYVYRQKSTLTQDHYTDYTYKQHLLNSKNLVYNTIDYPLEYLKNKEIPLVQGNRKEYDFNFGKIDRKNKGSLVSSLLTKDLETILIDETDSVKYKLMETVTDYWAYLLKHNQVNYLCEITDPLTNTTVRLNTKDAFKFYSVCLYASQAVTLEEFLPYHIGRVFNPTLPTSEQLAGLFYDLRFEDKQRLRELCDAVPMYRTIMTSYEFGEYVSHIYKLNIGLWHFLTNLSDMHTEGQMTLAVDTLTVEETYVFGDESVSVFLKRVGLKDPRQYPKEVLQGYLFSILDEVFDHKLSYLKRLKKLQTALAEVFSHFNSYTVQLINNYYDDSPLLAGIKDRRYHHTSKAKFVDVGLSGNVSGQYVTTGSTESSIRSEDTVVIGVTAEHGYRSRANYTLDALVDIEVERFTQTKHYLYGFSSEVIDTDAISTVHSNADIDLHSAMTHTSNRYRTCVEIDLHVGFDCTVRSKTLSRGVMEMNVSLLESSGQMPSLESSDPTLLFLALNS